MVFMCFPRLPTSLLAESNSSRVEPSSAGCNRRLFAQSGPHSIRGDDEHEGWCRSFFTRESMGHTDAMHLAGRNPACPLLAPALHADLSGFPPMLLQARTNEVLLDDSARLATRGTRP
jgi:hypothetical protein